MPADSLCERVDVLRQSFIETLRDPATLADAQRVRLEIEPLAGDEVQILVAKMFATAPGIIASLKTALAQQP